MGWWDPHDWYGRPHLATDWPYCFRFPNFPRIREWQGSKCWFWVRKSAKIGGFCPSNLLGGMYEHPYRRWTIAGHTTSCGKVSQKSAHRCWKIGLSVALVSRAKTVELIEMPFGMRTRVGPRNNILDGGPNPSWERAILRGRGVVHYKVWDTLWWWAEQKQLNWSRCCLGYELWLM